MLTYYCWKQWLCILAEREWWAIVSKPRIEGIISMEFLFLFCLVLCTCVKQHMHYLYKKKNIYWSIYQNPTQ